MIDKAEKIFFILLIIVVLPLNGFSETNIDYKLSVNVESETSGVIHQILKKVSTNSLENKALDNDIKADLLELDTELVQFDYTGYLQADVVDSKDPQTSPFSSDSTKKYEYSAGISKLWKSGIESTLSYSLTDNLTTFPSRDSSDFFSPNLGLTLKTNVFQDLFSGRHSLIKPKVLRQKKSVMVKSKIEKKAVLAEALLKVSAILEVKKELLLQRKLCGEIAEQAKNMRFRKERGSVPLREYLLSKKELNICLATNKSILKGLNEKRSDLEVNYGLTVGDYKNIDINSLFDEAKNIFKKMRVKENQLDIELNNDVVSLVEDLEALKIEKRQSKALAKPNLTFEITGGVKGLNEQFSAAHDDVSSLDFPYLLATMKMEFPVKNKEAVISDLANKYKIMAAEERLELLKRQKKSRVKVLESNLEQDLVIYSDYQKNVELSKMILFEANKDFNNGKINFNVLSEFQKDLIQSRKQLADLRKSIIINLIEYVDYFSYFHQYLEVSK